MQRLGKALRIGGVGIVLWGIVLFFTSGLIAGPAMLVGYGVVVTAVSYL